MSTQNSGSETTTASRKAGLKMRDILGYTTVVLIASGLVFATTMLLVSL